MKKKSMLTALAGFAAAGALSFAAPANAYYGGCYIDDYGRCMYAAPELMTGPDSPADMAAWGRTPDQHFAYEVTHDDLEPFTVINNFDGVKAEGLLTCGLEARGTGTYAATEYLEAAEGYSFDEAVNVDSSAYAVYCPWVPVSPTASTSPAV